MKKILTALALLAVLVLAGCHDAWGPHPNGSFTFPPGSQIPFGTSTATDYPSPWNQKLTAGSVSYLPQATADAYIDSVRNGGSTPSPNPIQAGHAGTGTSYSPDGSDYYSPVVFGDEEDDAENADGPWDISGGSSVDTPDPACSSYVTPRVDGLTVEAPVDLEPTPSGTDEHLAILDDQHRLWSLSGVSVGSRPHKVSGSWVHGTLSVSNGRKTNVTCAGIRVGPSSSRFPIGAGAIRAEELAVAEGQSQASSQELWHALWFASDATRGDPSGNPCDVMAGLACNNGQRVYPAMGSDGPASRSATTYPPFGTRFQLDPAKFTESWITGTTSGTCNCPLRKQVIIRTARDYGFILGDTTSNGWKFDAISGASYTPFGQQDALVAYAIAHGISPSGGLYSIGYALAQTDHTWANVKVVDPCSNVGAGNSSWQTGCPVTPTCNLYASTSGSDSTGTGTLNAPYRTPQKLADSLSAGQTGCLRAGTYSSTSKLEISSGGSASATPITLMSYPGERATIAYDWVHIQSGASYVTLHNLNINTTSGPSHDVTVWVESQGVVLDGNDITNGNAGLNCIFLNGGGATRIRHNKVHDCGQYAHGNQDHGIYASSPTGAQITDNWFWHVSAFPIHLYENAQGSYVARNVIDGSGYGVIFAGKDTYRSSNNVVEWNVISNATIGYNVQYSWGTAGPGIGNVLRDNVIYNGASGDIMSPYTGFTVESNNTFTDPLYVDRAAHDFRVQSSSPAASFGLWDGSYPP